jgi:signal transduction histidine kinase
MTTNPSLESRLAVTSLVFAALVAAVFGALVIAVVNLRNATRLEARSQSRTEATLTLEKLVLDVETGARGLVITQNERSLKPWTDARKQLPATLAKFERLFEDSPDAARARTLTRLIQSYVSDYSVPLVELARRNAPAAQSSAASFEGRLRIDAIRARFASLLKAEHDAAAANARSANRFSRNAIWITVAGLSVTALLIVAFAIYLARGIARPLRAAADGATRLAAGDLDARVEEKGPGEVGELTRAFNEMASRLQRNRAELEAQNERLRESERLKSELISIVSHELRTPLASILGFTALLRQRELDDASQRRYLEIVDDQGRRLAALLNDFLDAQRVDEGRLDLVFEPIDLAVLLRKQAQLFVGQSDRHAIRVSVPSSLPVRGDPNRLAQVVANLLSNAIKYSPAGGHIDVSARHDDGVVHVDVRDEGLGIPRTEQARVFTKFFRGEAVATGIGGTGLGLALSREIVEAHHGRIGFTSEPGTGSTFWLELPADDAEPETAEYPPKGAT